ncbi:973_t:CDS:10 [Entrophospora sp. SA101]|nr:973_t:CDS:10 [Entrophospora sp. SA101]
MAASLATYPHEVVRTRLQNQTVKPFKYKGVWNAIKLINQEEGLMAFYKGMSTNLLRTVPSTSNGTADAVSIMIALNIESMAANEECFVVVECIYRETFKMIGESDSVKNEEDDYGNAEWQTLKLSSGHMYQIDIPSSFIGKEYHLFFNFLIKEHKAVSLGLYRLTRHEGGYLRYIYVNPKTVTILRNDDRNLHYRSSNNNAISSSGYEINKLVDRNTQYVKIDQDPIPYPRIYQNADLIIACIILVQYIPHIWLADEPLQSFISVYSVLTWLSVFPVIAASIITIFDDEIDNTYMGAGILTYRASNGTADAVSIMIALNIESMAANEECFVVVECIYRETFKMIGESDSVKNEEDDYGTIVKRLIFSHDPDNKMSTPKFNNAQDDEWQSLKISSGHMYQIDIPSSFIGISFIF